MITRNDRKFLSESLKDMESVADEVIITDIGSTDGTVEMAEKAGAKVYRMKWGNNWSAVRNNCLEHAGGRWVLFLSANEAIPEDQRKELASLLNNPNAEAYLFCMDNRPGDGSVVSPVQFLRMFRNRSEYRYQYKVFERIPDEVLTNVEDSRIRIVLRDEAAQADDMRLRSRLLKEELAKYPEDSYLQYIKGVLLLNRRRFSDSAGCLHKALQNVNYECLYVPHLFKCLSWSLIYLQRHEEALELLDEGVTEFPPYYDLIVLRGELRRQLGQYEAAILDLKTALDRASQYDISIPPPEIDSHIILELLGETYENMGYFGDSLSCYRKAWESDTENTELANKIAGLSEKANPANIQDGFLQ